MSEDAFQLWSYLSSGPLLWLWVTLLAYLAGDTLFRLSGRKPLVNPVLIAGTQAALTDARISVRAQVHDPRPTVRRL